jgi:succinylarginine dihydrolase
MRAWEINFDGLPGPTHNYAGLSPGNLASTASAGCVSHPRAAALQGLAKMATLHALGVPQAVLPPQPRPALDWLRRLGFEGHDARVVEHAARESPDLLAVAYSASSMWAANAATVIPSTDATDARLHLVPANLSSERHRAIEAPFTSRLLQALFPDPERFAHHRPLPLPGDEGAANHMRFCRNYAEPGVEIFVYGCPRSDGSLPPAPASDGSNAEAAPVGRHTRHSVRHPTRHPARQSEEASRAVARLAHLPSERTLFLQQSPRAIDAGVFHNDVIATGDRGCLFLHEDAFMDQRREIDRLRRIFTRDCQEELDVIEVERARLPIERAVSTYLFNCQIVARPDGRRAWIGPSECREDDATAQLLEELASPGGPFDELHFVDLHESMRNGGGPACLRLRIVLTESERSATHAGVHFDESLHSRLTRIVERHYREILAPADLADPALIDESRTALDAVTQTLGLGSVYDFQRP